MVTVVLFHHVRGLTPGVQAFADALRAGGHEVRTPDLFDGQLPATLAEGVALADRLGDELDARVERVVGELPAAVVYAGFSLGAGIAQRLAQTRPGALGALLYEACLPVTGEWAVGPWPAGVPVQIHGMDGDAFFAGEGDLEAARGLVAAAGPRLAELFTYPGDRHLFTDSSLASYDDEATGRVLERSADFLARLG